MLQQKIKPIFVLGEYYNNLNDHENHLTFNEVELLKTLTIYKIFIIQPDLQNSSTKNVKIINNITYVDEPHENAAKAFYNLYVNELI